MDTVIGTTTLDFDDNCWPRQDSLGLFPSNLVLPDICFPSSAIIHDHLCDIEVDNLVTMTESMKKTPKGTVVLTGANGGLGVAMVKKIVSRPELAAFHGLYVVRDATSSPALQSAIKGAARPHPHDVLSLDLTRLDDVRKVAASINSLVAAGEIPPIRALILNAAYLEFENQTWTEDGFDTTFAAAYLGHWLLTMLLLQSMDRDSGRIVVIGSSAHE